MAWKMSQYCLKIPGYSNPEVDDPRSVPGICPSLNVSELRNAKDAVGIYKIARRSRIQRLCSFIEQSMPDKVVEQLKLETMLGAAT